MRVVSFPQAALQTAPVAAVERTGAGGQGRTPAQDGVGQKRAERGGANGLNSVPARTPRQYLQADAALVGIGLTAQNMFHGGNGGPAEENIVRAAKAYADIDGMRYRQTPFSYRVV
ncbi:MAG: hypothetical protein ACPGRZ_01215 [Alphaproteobacteria bacterium]